ncbi:hypothetical protein FJ656_15180 [Schumannella luteola]|uniref:Uncharacterized protein n=1 Tax=Schumannella luteola TaxID=472059 RepID=A0A852YQP7_9MICO|nr:hypothetical protein [Schumannella luteola]NYG99555.1 hypothetical protein [Schumannella luteola]TPX03871.1 hypothetical protein FJ656_15180 [Schumannella luteola]
MNPYLVPFEVDRETTRGIVLRNVGPEKLRGVSLMLTGAGLMPLVHAAVLPPATALRVQVRGADLALDSAIIVRWLRPDGSEYLWRIVF